MFDMLVKLYGLPELHPAIEVVEGKGYAIRRAMAYERTKVSTWLHAFHPEWVEECEASFAQSPISCFIATCGGEVVGFASYDVAAKNMFGPTGVQESARGAGLGAALLLSCLHQMRSNGYAYGIIGGVGPRTFYEKTVGAVSIEGSTPGIYVDC
jgi:GNAT superfamily N-acetyltransferase